MTTVKNYRIYCNTDSKWEYKWSETAITSCPVDPVGHSINASSVSIVDTISDSSTTIVEEQTPTGGHFRCDVEKVVAAANTTTDLDISWPIPIGALSIAFHPDSGRQPDGTWDATLSQRGDSFDIIVSPDTTTGTLAGNVKAEATISAISVANPTSVTATAHGLANGETYYFYGSDSVPSINGLRVVTVVDANTFTVPVDVTTAGTTGTAAGQSVLAVSQTVIDNAELGYYIKLDDGTNVDNCGRITNIDTINNTLTVETAATNDFDISTPTHIKMSVYMMKNFIIGAPGRYSIGDDKIGASFIDKNTTIRIAYTNSTSSQKDALFIVEYLY